MKAQYTFSRQNRKGSPQLPPAGAVTTSTGHRDLASRHPESLSTAKTPHVPPPVSPAAAGTRRRPPCLPPWPAGLKLGPQALPRAGPADRGPTHPNSGPAVPKAQGLAGAPGELSEKGGRRPLSRKSLAPQGAALGPSGWVGTPPGAGSTWRVYLPRADDGEFERSRALRSSPAGPAQGAGHAGRAGGCRPASGAGPRPPGNPDPRLHPGRRVRGSSGGAAGTGRWASGDGQRERCVRAGRPCRLWFHPAPTPTLSSQSLPLSWDSPVSEISQLLCLAKKVNNSSAGDDDSPSGADTAAPRGISVLLIC